MIDGDDEYDRRGFFPGQPFRRNEFYPRSNEPIAVCTPSIKGAASSQHGGERGGRWMLCLLIGAVGHLI